MIIALAGHVDHGKTALIRALTGIDADRLPEEKQRGMTIDLGFAHLRLASGALVGFVDVPGHERFLGNMLAGVLSIDSILLVVAADDGPMPQTLEHLAILRLTGVTDIAAVISKIDRVDAARLDAARAEIRALLADDADVMEVSSITGSGIPSVMRYIETKAAAHRARDPGGGFRMAIDRSFTAAGTGLVVTGTIAAGRVSVGDRLLLSPARLAARVRAIQVHHEAAATAQAGDRCAIAISGPRVERAKLKRGDWLIDPALHAPTRRIDVSLRAVDGRGPRHAARAHVHFGAGAIGGRVLLHDGEDLAPGAAGFAAIALDRPGACLYGDRIILRDESTGRVVAGGHVIDPFSPERRVRRERRASALAAHAIADPGLSFQALMDAEGWADPVRFALARNLPAPAAPAVLISDATVTVIGGLLSGHLAAFHARYPDQLGPGKAEVLRAAAAFPANIAETVLERQRAAGVVIRDGLAWRLPDHCPVLSPPDEAWWTRIQAALTKADLRPPRVRELAAEMNQEPEAMEALLLRIERFGRLVRVAPNRFFLPETVTALGLIARDMTASLEEGGFTAAEFNKRTGIGRNLTIIVLEHLDRTGATARAGDLRHAVRSIEEMG